MHGSNESHWKSQPMGGGTCLENRLREIAWGFDSPLFRDVHGIPRQPGSGPEPPSKADRADTRKSQPIGAGTALLARQLERAYGFDSRLFRIETQGPVMGRPGVVEQD